jgi:glycosyltransferase involved in cell wall biosynthesis
MSEELVVTCTSVVIATHNRAELLPRAIRSALKQTHPAEVVVVDDASTDATRDVLENFGDSIVPVLLDENRERGAARNAGVAQSNGRFIAFLDSDDEFMPSHLSGLVDGLSSQPHAGVAYRRAEFVDATGRVYYIGPEEPLEGDIAVEIAIMNRFAFSSTMVRRSVFEQVGGFDEDRRLSGAEDRELWVRMGATAPVVYVPGATTRIHLHGGNTTADTAAHERALWIAYEKLVGNESLSGLLSPHREDIRTGIHISVARNYIRSGEPAVGLSRVLAAVRGRPRSLATRLVARTLARGTIDVSRKRLASRKH